MCVCGGKRFFALLAPGGSLQPVEGVDHYALAQSPILAAGDVCGSVIFLQGEENTGATPEQVKLAQAAALFLGKQMEE